MQSQTNKQKTYDGRRGSGRGGVTEETTLTARFQIETFPRGVLYVAVFSHCTADGSPSIGRDKEDQPDEIMEPGR